LAWIDNDRRGVMGVCTAVKMKDIVDGTSKTMLIGEVRIGLTAQDRRGVWAMGAPGASALVWHGFGGDDQGPNPCTDQGDDILGCSTVIAQVGLQRTISQCMPCWNGDKQGQGAARSRHLGGVYTATVDASVHFVSDLIVDSTRFSASPTPWDYY